ncbi:LysM peptidoglycan-binding domain-containing protein [Candidatus Falkowbacteria bacterium]|nr:LysM peptidoglycan-binding domain-containing protein [Candidatus Falkowbacteria bacterium]
MKKVSVLFVLVFGVLWASSASAESQTYTVQRGDRPERVAAQFGLTEEELLAANPRSSYGMACDNPFRITLRNRESQAICGQRRPYLIVGKTLVIPVSSLVLETENAELGDEMAALRAEMEEMRRERETEKSELAELRQERDNLRDENKTLVAAKAELQGKYSESQSDFVVVSSRQPKQVEVQGTNYVHIALAIASTAFLAVLVIIVIKYRKGKNEKKFDHLVQFVQPSVLEQAEKNKRRGAELDKQAKELERQAREQNELQARLQEQKSEQERRNKELEERDAGLRRTAEESDRCSQELREKNRELNGREAKLYLDRETLATGERVLHQDRGALARSWEEYRRKERGLAVKQAEVEAMLRTAEEDIPKLEKEKGEVTQRVDAVKVREIDAARREGEATAREEAAKQREDAAARREVEAGRREATASDQERLLAQRDKDAAAREEGLHQGEADLRTAQGDFAQEMSEQRAAFEREKGEARSLLARAKRKAEIVRVLDERAAKNEADAKANAAEARRLETMRGNLQGWEERLTDRERQQSGGEDGPTAVLPSLPGGEVDPSGNTHVDAPGSEPSAPADICMSICDVCGREMPLDELEDHRVSMHGVVCGACGRKFPDRGKFDEHRPECPKAVPHVRTLVGVSAAAGGRASAAAPPPESPTSGTGGSSSASCGPSTIYCKVCKAVFSPDVYAAEHAEHDQGLASGDSDKK